MFCPNCGTLIPDVARFCPECGQYVNVKAPDYQAAAPDPSTTGVPVAIPVPEEPLPKTQVSTQPPVAPEPMAHAPKTPVPIAAPATPSPAAPVATPPAQTGVNKVRLALSVAGAALALFIVVRAILFFAAPSSESHATGDDSAPVNIIPTDGDASASAVLAPGFEGHGYPTVSTLIDHSGGELRAALEDNGYVFYGEEDESGLWASEDGTIVLNAFVDYEMLSDDDLDDLRAGGAGMPTVYFLLFEGYDSCAAALDGMTGCEIADQAHDGAGDVIAECVDAAGERSYYVVLEDAGEGDVEMTVFNEEAAAEGLVEAMIDGVSGSSSEEILSSFAGRS